MIDTDKCKRILYDTMFNPIDVHNVAEELLAEVKRLREQYTELREALVGDSPNWTHEELVERALVMREPAELEFGEWHTDMGEEE